MTFQPANQTHQISSPLATTRSAWRLGVLIVLLATIGACLWTLERRLVGLEVSHVTLAETPVTLYRLAKTSAAPPVIVAHGFGGSRQMMDQIAISLARQGFFAASLDLPGHGRNPHQMSPDITRIEGTTAQLVQTVNAVTAAVTARPEAQGPVSFVGHSMATDVVIRAAQNRADLGTIVALSMYSPAVTATEPKSLLMLSGAFEGHLRKAALAALQQVDPTAAEGQTIAIAQINRRAAVAPFVGHVGVLYAPTSLREITAWMRANLSAGQAAPLDQTGWVSGILLAALVLLAWPLLSLLPKRDPAHSPSLPRRTFWVAVILPLPIALVPALLPVFGIAGQAAFGTMAAVFALWGLTQLLLLKRAGLRLPRIDLLGTFCFLLFGGLFALALDRYGAAFLPSGPRLWVMAGLFLGTLPLMVADTLLVHKAHLWRRLLARLALLVALSCAIALAPTDLGIAFTTLPVLLLFFLVYGTLARWVSARRGPEGVALAKGLALAWAIAASTPLFATSL